MFLILFSLRPAYYVAQITYYELNIDAIIQKYCVNKDKPQMQCNGKCHLAKQLQISETSDDPQSIAIVIQAFFPVFIVEHKDFLFSNSSKPIDKGQIFSTGNSYAHLRELRVDKPPIS